MAHVEGHKKGATKPYSESKDHVPDPTAISATLDTSGTAGGGHEKLENTVGVFDTALTEAAEQEAVGHAIEAEPDEDGVDNSGNNPLYRDEDLATGTADTTEGGAKTPQKSTKSTAKKTTAKKTPSARVRSKAPAKKAATKTAAKKATPAKKTAAKTASTRK